MCSNPQDTTLSTQLTCRPGNFPRQTLPSTSQVWHFLTSDYLTQINRKQNTFQSAVSRGGRPPRLRLSGCATGADRMCCSTSTGQRPRRLAHHPSTRTSTPTRDTHTQGLSTRIRSRSRTDTKRRVLVHGSAAPAHPSPQTTSWFSTTCGDTEDHRRRSDCGKRGQRTRTLLLRVASTQEQDAERPPHRHLTAPWRRRGLEKGGCPIRCLSGQ